MVNELAVTRSDGAIKKLGEFLIRYGLVLVLGWIGAMKFTAYEAGGIQGLIASSPLMSWMYEVFSVQATSNIIGVAEITAALLIAIRPISARLSLIGSVLAVCTFLATLTFLFSLPGWEKSLGGFPAFGVGRISAERYSVARRLLVDTG